MSTGSANPSPPEALNTTSIDAPMAELVLVAHDEQDTRLLGAALAELLPPGSVLALVGTLGAGKTRLVQAVASGLGIDPRSVTSPTFVLMQPYEGRRPLYHFDLYRLRDDDELLELGLEEYFSAGGLTAIEWADRFTDAMPPDTWWISIEPAGAEARRFCIRSEHADAGETLEALARRCPAMRDRAG